MPGPWPPFFTRNAAFIQYARDRHRSAPFRDIQSEHFTNNINLFLRTGNQNYPVSRNALVLSALKNELWLTILIHQ